MNKVKCFSDLAKIMSPQQEDTKLDNYHSFVFWEQTVNKKYPAATRGAERRIGGKQWFISNNTKIAEWDGSQGGSGWVLK